MEQKHDAWFKSAGPGFYHGTRPLENGGGNPAPIDRPLVSPQFMLTRAALLDSRRGIQ
jgi:hypothetical protein